MTTTPVRAAQPGARAAIPARTLRTDRWWVNWAVIAAILAFFTVYATVRVFMNRYYWVDEYHYLTPMYSPCLSDSCVSGSSHFGTPLPEMPAYIPIPIITFAVLFGFRATCYYYRKAGYRSFFLSPPGCAVGEPAKKYHGETRFPFNFTNYHRYFFLIAAVLLLVNTYDAGLAFHGKDGGFGIGLGTIIIWINLVMLWGYTLSCHACRHIVGGRLKHFSKHPIRYAYWTFVSKLNPKHGNFAMISLVTVILTDAYIMALAADWFSDPRLFN